MNDLIFIIEGGKALRLVKDHIAARQAVTLSNRALAKELGIEEATSDIQTGVLRGVVFKGAVHADFTKPSRKSISFPKKGTDWHKRFASQVGHEPAEQVISRELGVPTSLSYTTASGEGWRMIGMPFRACQFLWLTHDGPYAMVIPDVAAEVKDMESDGSLVTEPDRSFKAEFDGCRLIEDEEWELLVAQHNLAKKLALKAA